MHRYVCLLYFVILLSSNKGISQYKMSVQAGSMSYVGDLAPLSSSLSFSNPMPYFSVSIGTQLNSYLDINLKYTAGSVEGNDFDSKESGRRLRNLSFRSSIAEYGLSFNLDFNRLFLSSLDKHGIRVFYNTGINYFEFNPQTKYQNEWIDLKPLHTECQGCADIVDYGNYSLGQINIPFGLGFDFNISSHSKLGFIWTQRLLFTDYLDDVSNVYIDKNTLTDRFGPLSAAVSDRKYEVTGGDPLATNHFSPRGNPHNKDGYFTFGISFTYYFSPIILPTSAATQEAKKPIE